ncbi:MAG TPA: formyltetrahydrofolate deformylase [Nitrososphaeraceae archaeon]|nr:formyltetrahydrofolate deformylase [Nitrososphaeraceae archaeon]
MVSRSTRDKTLVEITVVGNDREGVVAEITNSIFRNGGNIEQINQKVVHGLFGMHLEASFRNTIKLHKIHAELYDLSNKLQMEIKAHVEEPNRKKNVAILVSKEPHCLSTILNALQNKKIDSNIPVIIGSEGTLRGIADKIAVPFYSVSYENGPTNAESKILTVIEDYNIDLIVLARYMRVLTPNFVWRYPNRIINIHPSLLPAFPGAFAYVQAFERGAKIVGCTAHFATEELDQGPIICQEAFKVTEDDTLDSIRKKGQELEAETLLEAVKLFLDDRLDVYWNKVHIFPNSCE